ncbi:MAG: DUF1738 domain-containing protein [Caulobacteraceae bacterium]|nr:DUF1738 domain-containing protein [Caulobacteraceae bacterium]
MRPGPRRVASGEGRGPRAARPAQDRASLYDEVTRKIVAELEAGRFPWVQPWGKAGAAGPGLPRNVLTRRPYSGVNVLILWGAVIAEGWPTQGWLTFRQALAAGGAVRKGEHGTVVVYADRFTPKAEAERAARAGEDPQAVPFLKRFVVFNAAQCDGLDPALTVAPAPLPERQAIPRAEALIAATGADVRIGGARAFYVPSRDFIQVPPQPAFREQINYYRTCFHELSHWTGHPSRLARQFPDRLGSDERAREELVAEMGAAFVCAALAIVPTVRHADYLASWLDVLRADNRAIFRAASQASRAADFILAFEGGTDEPAAAALAAPSQQEIAA